MNKKTMIIYDSWGEIIKNLPSEQAGEIAKALCIYAFDEEHPSFDNPALSAIFAMMKVKLDEDAKAYDEKVNRLNKNKSQHEVSMKSDRSQHDISVKSDRSQDEVKSVSESVSVSDNNYKEKEKRERPAQARTFTPPTIEEVKAYCQERRNNVDAQRFVDFYSSKGWMIGKTKMKDWKASVRTWETRETARSGTTDSFIKQDYDITAIERVLVKN